MKNRKLSLEELGRMDVETYRASTKIPVTVVLDDIRSALNVGSIFRTCDCIGVEKILLSGITAQPPHKEIFKTAIGATESVEWEYFPTINEALNSIPEAVMISVEQTTQSIPLTELNTSHLNKHVCIVLGNEVKGVSQDAIEQSSFCLEIPQYGTKHSFNVSVCAGIVLWELSQILRQQ